MFGTRPFFRLWLAQVLSSLGDWVGFLAILAIATPSRSSSAAAVSLVMVARMVPGLLPRDGRRRDRRPVRPRKVMVVSDLGRAVLISIAAVRRHACRARARLVRARDPHAALWARRRTRPSRNLVPDENLAERELALARRGVRHVPARRAGRSPASPGSPSWLDGFDALSFLALDRESLALWFDAAAFVVSALITLTIADPDGRTSSRASG